MTFDEQIAQADVLDLSAPTEEEIQARIDSLGSEEVAA